MTKHITDRGAKAVERVARRLSRSPAGDVPGPSTNPATNVLLQDIMLRSVGKIARHTLEKGLLRRSFDPDDAKKIVENRTLLHSIAAFGVTRLATRSLPGAVIVGGGLLAKTLFDRSQSRRKSRRAGTKMLAERIEE